MMPGAAEIALMCRAAAPEALVVVVEPDGHEPRGAVLLQLGDRARMTIAWRDDPQHGPGWSWSIDGQDVPSTGLLTIPEDLGHALCQLLGLPLPWVSRLDDLRREQGLGAAIAMAQGGDPWGLVECGRMLARRASSAL